MNSPYDMNCIVAISKKDDTFLDIRPLGTSKWKRVLIKRGDAFVFRGDVAHRGVEHKGDYTHYRIHCYCDVQGHRRHDNETIFVGCPFNVEPYWY